MQTVIFKVLYPAKMSFINKGKINTLSMKNWKFLVNNPTPLDMLKKVPHTEQKLYQLRTWTYTK